MKDQFLKENKFLKDNPAKAELSCLAYAEDVVLKDVELLKVSEKSYGDSWKKRGGVGAFMMLARKWDRLENQVKKSIGKAGAYDIFEHIKADTRPEGIIDDLGDLRRYLILVEAEMLSRGNLNKGAK